MAVGTSPNRIEEHQSPRAAPATDSESLGTLVKKLRDDTILLFREEIELAKAETSSKLARCGRNAGYGGLGAALALAGVLALIAAASTGVYAGLIAAGVSQLVSIWLAPLIVGLVAAGVGYALIQKAVTAISNEPVVPQRTARTLQENKEWIKEKM